MRLRLMIQLAAIGACFAAPARADVSIYYHAGGWDVFNGTDDRGQPVCGIGSHNPADGRTFSVRFELGGSGVTFVASKTGWNIPDRTIVPVVVQIGLNRPWTEQATGHGDRLQWTLDSAAYQAFDGQFRGASSMTVTFPTGNEQPWVIALVGSSAASTAMGRCVEDMARRAPAPAAAPAPESGPVTQPFGATPAAPAANAPAPNAPASNAPASNAPASNAPPSAGDGSATDGSATDGSAPAGTAPQPAPAQQDQQTSLPPGLPPSTQPSAPANPSH